MGPRAVERQPLFAFIADLARGNGGVLPDSSVSLPDEGALETPGGLRWSAGTLDGVLGHHGFGNGTPDAGRVVAAIRSATARDAALGFDELYVVLQAEDRLPVVDAVVEAVAADPRIDRRRLCLLMSIVARRAPDRGPVKFALAILGAFGERGEHEALLATFGLHDEFALYAVAALLRAARDPEAAVWSRRPGRATGWGRIAAIGRLAGAARPEIKRWLVRQGYRNRVMDEYTALICAETGDLAGELSRPALDEDVRRGAGAILQALIAEGPADGISEYGAASMAVRLYVGHLRRGPVGTTELRALLAIRDYLRARPDDPGRLDAWTKEERASCLALAVPLLDPARHAARLRKEVASGTPDESWNASGAARGLGLDVWDQVFARLRSDPLAEGAPWWNAMRTGDGGRVRAVADLAERALPLNRMVGAPTLAVWPTRDVAAFTALDFVLQGLAPHPGVGAALIRAGLRSPLLRNRHMALRALSEWPRGQGSADWLPALDAAHAVEPDPDVKARLAALREGWASAVAAAEDDDGKNRRQ